MPQNVKKHAKKDERNVKKYAKIIMINKPIINRTSKVAKECHKNMSK